MAGLPLLRSRQMLTTFVSFPWWRGLILVLHKLMGLSIMMKMRGSLLMEKLLKIAEKGFNCLSCLEPWKVCWDWYSDYISCKCTLATFFQGFEHVHTQTHICICISISIELLSCRLYLSFFPFFFLPFIAPRQFRSLNNDGQSSLKQKILKLEDLNISL